jgi:hypothetical protein
MSWGYEEGGVKGSRETHGDGLSPSTPRKFTLVDAMILIAATGAALVPIRYLLPFIANLDSAQKPTFVNIWFDAALVSATAKPLVIAWSTALCILRLRKPRPSIRRVFRQPGMAACTAIVVSFLFESSKELIWFYHQVLVGIPEDFNSLSFDYLYRLHHNVSGGPILIAWTMLYLSRIWRPEGSWMDRAGRILGAYYLADSIVLGSGILRP